MPGREVVNGKPRRSSIRAENLARFAENAGELGLTFLDRDGKPMSADRWIEARTDPDYFLVGVDRLECLLEVATSWIGIHINGTPKSVRKSNVAVPIRPGGRLRPSRGHSVCRLRA